MAEYSISKSLTKKFSRELPIMREGVGSPQIAQYFQDRGRILGNSSCVCSKG
jgi:hypothetical protein